GKFTMPLPSVSLRPALASSANGWGNQDERGEAIRELNRNEDFSKDVTMALDRKAIGDSLVKGPLTAIYPGGLSSGT
ncbi:hypothetical protein, partial [Rhizobium leguminosarum]|uniref:hypothetical protein n=1 Tax=Rhizobium leguminosarum TaxID=384 RepID=UPI003F9D5B4C